MDIKFYEKEIDKFLAEFNNYDVISSEQKDELVNLITDAINQYHNKISRSRLHSLINYLIENRYEVIYNYNDSIFNNSDPESDEDIPIIKSIEKSSKNSDKCDINIDIDIGGVDEPFASFTFDDLDDTHDQKNEFIDKNIIRYCCPEDEVATDKISLDSYKDLVSHRHDYDKDKFKEKIYINRKKIVYNLKQIPQHEQKSAGWLQQRNECITATGVAIVIDEDPYKFPIELLFDKTGRGPPFIENENVHHGKKSEELGTMFYSFRNNISVNEFGLLQHPVYTFIGASPDGICSKKQYDENGLSKLVGRLLEIKFPFRRKINTIGELDGDICPHYYHVQVLTQLYVTGLDECDFLQCELEEYESYEDFIADSNTTIPGLSKKTNLEKGPLIQLLPKKMINDDPLQCLYAARYLYPPKMHMTVDEIKIWIAESIINFPDNDLYADYIIDKVLYWRFRKIACHLIKAQTTWFESKIPILKQFWTYVEFYRKQPKLLNNLVEYVKEVGASMTSDIFAKIHRDYQKLNPKSTLKQLYREPTKWRLKYDEKYGKSKFYKKLPEKSSK